MGDTAFQYIFTVCLLLGMPKYVCFIHVCAGVPWQFLQLANNENILTNSYPLVYSIFPKCLTLTLRLHHSLPIGVLRDYLFAPSSPT